MYKKLDSEDRDTCLSISCGKVQEEEFCRILDLRKSLQFSDILIKHMSQYLTLGWQLVAVNSQNRVHQFINFQEPKEIWSDKLIELSLDGVDVNVGVRTGSASGLLILEVNKRGRTLPFRRDDWSSDCVAEAGVLFEQHYYELPGDWQIPQTFFLEPFEVKVFGEGDLALVPPSVEPRTQSNWRWLKPPWEIALSQPPPILKKIMKGAAPGFCLPASAIPPWEKIYPAIASHPSVLQALMYPAASPESYYQHLLEAAWARGLHEPQLLLGLLWHAPWGDARERPQGQKYLQDIISQGFLTGELNVESRPDHMAGQSPEPARSVDSRQSSQPVAGDCFSRVTSGSTAIPSDWLSEEKPSQSQKPGGPQPGNEEFGESWQEFFRVTQENLIVERRRYEAMIYELGKLRVWQEICQQERRENKRLNLKLTAHLAQEVDYLRQLLKKNS
ncbi:MAG: hypothetical protein ACOZFS_12415 [Thermodesulfobacteriota bacterium]